MATHSSVLAWRIPGTGEPGLLLSIGSHRVRHNWRDLAAAAALIHLPWKPMGLAFLPSLISLPQPPRFGCFFVLVVFIIFILSEVKNLGLLFWSLSSASYLVFATEPGWVPPPSFPLYFCIPRSLFCPVLFCLISPSHSGLTARARALGRTQAALEIRGNSPSAPARKHTMQRQTLSALRIWKWNPGH